MVDEQQNYKLHRLICHPINEVVQLIVVVVVAAAVINIILKNKEIIQMVCSNPLIFSTTILSLVGNHRGGGWSARGGAGAAGDRPYSGGGYQQVQYDPYGQPFDPYMQQHPQMGYQGQQQIINEYAGMEYNGRGRGGGGGRRGGRGGRRPY